jgi:tetratricopeptide (TPR) repeat protein
MKRLMLMALVVGVTLSTVAQKEEKEAPKPNINKALNLVRQGKFDEAKAIVDGVPTHSKTMNDAKAWMHRGIVYAAMDTSRKYTGGAKDNTKVAGEAFTKAIALAGPKASSLNVLDNAETLTLDEIVKRFNNKFIYMGDKFFKEDNYKDALSLLEKGLDLTPDSSIYQYAGYAAYNSDDTDKAIDYIGKYFAMGGKNLQARMLQIGAVYEIKKDYNRTIELTREALKVYPNNSDLRKIQLNCLIELKRYEEATENLKSAIKADPKDVESYYLLGLLYEELKNRAESKAAFETTVKLDPKHLNASLALAKIADQEGYKTTKAEMDKLDFRKDKEKMIVLDKKYLEQLGESVTRWEAVYKLDNNNADVLGNLDLLYGQLEMKDKHNMIISRMKALGLYDN